MRQWIRVLAGAAMLAQAVGATAEPARLERRGEATQLIVDGKPFLVLGGELANSSASHRQDLAPAWARFQAMHMNTALAPVSWELIGPREGEFDFSTVDWLIADAQAHDMRLVLLWFGTWKNSMSSYAPAWVKQDTARFARTRDGEGHLQEIISAYSKPALEADSRAFAALMAHIARVDREVGTVIMVQVENEMGFLPLAREGGVTADPAADEREQARAYARYANAVARAGKSRLDIPMYVNGAQNRPGANPGEYPSGGPLPHLADEWQKQAPAIDFIAPDIYFDNFAAITDAYAAVAPLLFIPEADRADSKRVGANALRAIGRHDAIGFSPFSIDTAGPEGQARLASLYGMLGQIAPQILEAQAKGRIAGISNPVNFAGEIDTSPITVELGGYRITATTLDPWTPKDAQDQSMHGALIIWLGGNDYLFAGQGVTFTMAALEKGRRAGLEKVEEGHLEKGRWIATRRLNGDQTHQGRHVRLPPGEYQLQKVVLYSY